MDILCHCCIYVECVRVNVTENWVTVGVIVTNAQTSLQFFMGLPTIWLTLLGVPSWVRFCRQEFGEFPRPAWAVGSYSSGPPAGWTPQILDDKTSPMMGSLRVYCVCGVAELPTYARRRKGDVHLLRHGRQLTSVSCITRHFIQSASIALSQGLVKRFCWCSSCNFPYCLAAQQLYSMGHCPGELLQ